MSQGCALNPCLINPSLNINNYYLQKCYININFNWNCEISHYINEQCDDYTGSSAQWPVQSGFMSSTVVHCNSNIYKV